MKILGYWRQMGFFNAIEDFRTWQSSSRFSWFLLLRQTCFGKLPNMVSSSDLLTHHTTVSPDASMFVLTATVKNTFGRRRKILLWKNTHFQSNRYNHIFLLNSFPDNQTNRHGYSWCNCLSLWNCAKVVHHLGSMGKIEYLMLRATIIESSRSMQCRPVKALLHSLCFTDGACCQTASQSQSIRQAEVGSRELVRLQNTQTAPVESG